MEKPADYSIWNLVPWATATGVSYYTKFGSNLPKIMSSYGFDFGAPCMWYNILRMSGVSRAISASTVFTIPSILEIGQKVGFYGGTFDPKDFIAYAAGTATALLIDVALTPKKSSLEGKTLQLAQESVQLAQK